MDPEVLIYGDPFVGLDPISMGLLCDSFGANDVPCLTGIVDSHDVHENLTVADGIVLLSGGYVVARRMPQQLQSYSIGDRAAIHGRPCRRSGACSFLGR
jgi:phospholipid/cholesterol/gamma-HCH transport system ATP-binding protein